MPDSQTRHYRHPDPGPEHPSEERLRAMCGRKFPKHSFDELPPNPNHPPSHHCLICTRSRRKRLRARNVNRHHAWTDEEREILRREYAGTRQSRQEIAAKLGVTEFAVAGQIGKMGIAKRTDRRPWTPEEDELLQELVTRKSMTAIAKKMGRTINSVTVRAKRIQAPRTTRDGWYTMREVCQILGVGHKWLRTRIESGAFPAIPHHGRHPQKAGGGAWHIEEKDLRQFIRRYPHELNGRNVDLLQVVDILAGVTPI